MNLDRRKFLSILGASAIAQTARLLKSKKPENISTPKLPSAVIESKTKERLVVKEKVETVFEKEVAEHYAKLQKTRGDILQNLEKYAFHRRKIELMINNYKPKNLPPEVWSEIKKYVIALAATESRFDVNIKNSTASAVGLFQITRIAYEDLKNVRTEERGQPLPSFNDVTNPEVAAKIAVAILDESTFPKIESQMRDISEWIGLSEGNEARFMALCILNAYNAGPTNMARLFDKLLTFTEKVDASPNLGTHSTTAEVLFDLVREHRINTDGLLETSYRDQAYEYVAKIVAAEQFIRTKYSQKGNT